MSPAAILKNPASLEDFRGALLTWYRANRRALPWRKTRDPYRIWVSEIMLQQTRVAAVLEHYRLFLRKFPTVKRLAAAEEADVLAAWSGLGYYRRARMLHAAAKVVTSQHAGRLPRSSRELQVLPGIGRYTANAIASIAFEEAVAVVDGNVARVLARLVRSKDVRECWKDAELLLDRQNPGDFNQAMMELGATVCLPGVPVCKACPVGRVCLSRGIRRAASKTKPQRRQRSCCLALVRRKQEILLKKRSPDERIMAGMWELPAIHNPTGSSLLALKHSITNTDWEVSVFACNHTPDAAAQWIALAAAGNLPLTGLTRKILRRLKLLVHR